MNIWGERFSRAGDFICYCRELNVQTDERELEHYERIGVMLPVARVVYPEDYVVQSAQTRWAGVLDWDGSDQWLELGRLTERTGMFPNGYADLADEELVHCFDRELADGNNPYLSEPGSFRPWGEYSVMVPFRGEQAVRQSTAEHYYSYWQVHHLSLIQKYPDLYTNFNLIEHIPDDNPVRKWLPRSPNKQSLADFEGKRRFFDALSFWITMSGRERGRTFARVAEINGIRRLADDEADEYGERLAAHGRRVMSCFQVTRDDLFGFLRELISLLEGYRRDERYKLAEELERDIFAWEDLLRTIMGASRDQVGEELGRANTHDERTFRHLDIVTRERDAALDVVVHAADECSRILRKLGDSEWSFTERDASELLHYCEREGLGVLRTALSGMVATGHEEYRRNFRRVQMYTNLKNFLTSYEYLLKTIAQDAKSLSGREPLTLLVGKVMKKEDWLPLFETRRSAGFVSAANTEEFVRKLSELFDDSDLSGTVEGYWARTFLVTCLSRNFTVHSYPTDDRYYGDLFGRMLAAAIPATIYTWKLGKRNGWV